MHLYSATAPPLMPSLELVVAAVLLVETLADHSAVDLEDTPELLPATSAEAPTTLHAIARLRP
jgi:hypothetical protein